MRMAQWLSVLLVALSLPPVFGADRPNIVLIYADDIGYGDLGCYGATKVKTPACDRLAAGGVRFTDAHSVASVCTPSRYSLMTGEYAFRKKGTGIASGIEGLLIEPSRTTLPGLLQKAGYATAVVGKWHLGLGTTPTNYNAPIAPGPKEVGFGTSWIMPATGDRVPCVWVENGRVVGLDAKDPIQLDYTINRGDKGSFIRGIPRIGGQTGGQAALWDDEGMGLLLAQKGCDFIHANKEKPFFLYLATHNIHVPRAPNPMFRGKSECGVRGDAIVEFDAIVGQVLQQLEKDGLAQNTIVILSSDNGGVNDDNGPDKVHGIGDPDATNGHRPNGVLRGAKSGVFEGGTRVPMIVRWPARVKPGTSEALFSQMDYLASFATLVEQKIPSGQAPDSEDHLPVLLGEKKMGREYLVEQTNNGAPFGFRHGQWKLIPGGTGMGGAKGKPPSPQLYDLSTDLSESKNLASMNAERVASMKAKLDEIVKGR
ncbi:MAG: sulfatase family protein [Gemmataceae bacterium]